MCRRDAEQHRDKKPYAVISFGDPHQRMPAFCEDPHRHAVLRIQCEDDDVPGDPHTFTMAHAHEVFEFVENLPARITHVLVHCEAGISRSRGCALALSAIYGDPAPHLQRGEPNMLIVRRLLEAYNGRGNEHVTAPAVLRNFYACLRHPYTPLTSDNEEDLGPATTCSECGSMSQPVKLDRLRLHAVYHPEI